jgi:hypothetical protein
MSNRGRVLVHRRNEQTMAHFLPSRYKVCGLYECRGICYMVTMSQVKVKRVL